LGGGGGSEEAEEAREELDAKREGLVTSFKGVVDELHTAGTLPGNITVDETDVGLLQSQGIDSADKLKTSLKSKPTPAGWNGGSLSDYIDALSAPAAPQQEQAEAPAVEDEDENEPDTGDSGEPDAAPAPAAEVEKPKPSVTFSPPEGVDMKENTGSMCKIKLDSGEFIVADREYIRIGSRKFKIVTEQSVLVGSVQLPVQVDRIIPDANGGCVLGMSTVTGGLAQEAPLTPAKVLELVKTLVSHKDEDEFLYDAPKKDGGTRPLKLIAVA